MNCKRLIRIDFPANLKTIAMQAFEGCESLATVNFPNNLSEIGNNAFYGCTSLSSARIPDNLLMIGENAFFECPSQVSMRLPNSCIIKGPIFSERHACNEIIIDSDGTLVFYPEQRTETEYFAPQNITSIAPGAFSNNKYIQSIKLPAHVHNIGAYAFAGCSNLVEVSLSKKIEKIENGLFFGCRNLKHIPTFPHLKMIGERAFEGCSTLQTFDFPAGVTIGEKAFADCTSLRTVILNAVELGSEAFYKCGIQSLLITNTQKIAASHVFTKSKLVTVELGNGVKYIGPTVFGNIHSMKELFVHSSLEFLSKSCFSPAMKVSIVLKDDADSKTGKMLIKKGFTFTCSK